jgi:hypothetical protein
MAGRTIVQHIPRYIVRYNNASDFCADRFSVATSQPIVSASARCHRDDEHDSSNGHAERSLGHPCQFSILDHPFRFPESSRAHLTGSTYSTRWAPISGGSGSKCGPSQCRQGVAGSPLHDNGRRPRNHGGRPATRPQHRQKPADAYQRCSPHPPPPHPALGQRNCQLPLYFTD